MHRSDGNQKIIVEAMRKAGARLTFVESPIKNTRGVPDVIIDYAGLTNWAEIKNPAGKNKVSLEQDAFRTQTPGDTVWLIRSVDDGLQVLRTMRAVGMRRIKNGNID